LFFYDGESVIALANKMESIFCQNCLTLYSKIQWRVSAEMVSMYSSSLQFSEILLLILGMMQAFVPNMMFAKPFRSIVHSFLSISCPKCLTQIITEKVFAICFATKFQSRRCKA